ncbi:MAG: hypothetical protein LBT59_05955 [Clostridiales bacterium]|jgi:hypothetical protein|nr:hypothetical protein [Clostridiales bacterium]
MVPGSYEYNEELGMIKLRIDGAKRLATSEGVVDAQTFCAYLEKIMAEADRVSLDGNHALGQGMCDVVMVTLAKIATLPEMDVDLQNFALRVKALIEKIVSRVAPASQEASFILRQALRDASNKAFLRWEEFAYYMIQCPARLATAESVRKVEVFLDKFKGKIIEQAKQTKWFEGLDRLVRYEAISSLKGEDATKELLHENLQYDDFRLAVVDAAVKKENYAYAIELCEEKLETLDDPGYTQISDRPLWYARIYEAAELSDNIGKILETAENLVRYDRMEYYGRARAKLTAMGKWEEGKRKLLSAIEDSCPEEMVIKLLDGEDECWRLVKFFQKNCERVFEYADRLSMKYPAETYQACKSYIRNKMALALKRSGYREACAYIQLLHKIGGRDEAFSLITELKAKYAQKPAIVEELTSLAAVLNFSFY